MIDTFVIVRRQPNDYRTAKYLLSSFENPHWDTVSGGIKTVTFGKPFIYGYVQCTDAVEGEVAHSGQLGLENHGQCPHRIKVCALKKDNKAIYNTLLEMAGPRPTESSYLPVRLTFSNYRRCRSLFTYRECILSHLETKGRSEGDMFNIFSKSPYNLRNISALRTALTRLVNEGRIICKADLNNRSNNFYEINLQ